jgi:hypothetical protein
MYLLFLLDCLVQHGAHEAGHSIPVGLVRVLQVVNFQHMRTDIVDVFLQKGIYGAIDCP